MTALAAKLRYRLPTMLALRLAAPLLALTWLATCGGKAIVDPPLAADDDGSGGASSSSAPATITVSAGPSTVASGGPECLSCFAWLTSCLDEDCPDENLICDGDQRARHDALVDCLCAECADTCGATCGTGMGDDEGCGGCLQDVSFGPCFTVFNACATS